MILSNNTEVDLSINGSILTELAALLSGALLMKIPIESVLILMAIYEPKQNLAA